jgi:hypothetical protein
MDAEEAMREDGYGMWEVRAVSGHAEHAEKGDDGDSAMRMVL